jgi:hypothetical protein
VVGLMMIFVANRITVTLAIHVYIERSIAGVVKQDSRACLAADSELGVPGGFDENDPGP